MIIYLLFVFIFLWPINVFVSKDEIDYGTKSSELGFPVKHNHKLATLRRELLDAFVDDRYLMFLKNAAVNLQSSTLNKTESKNMLGDKEDKFKEEIIKQIDNASNPEKTSEEEESTTEVVKKDDGIEKESRRVMKIAAAAVGSLSESEFDIRFNADIFSPGVRHVGTESDRFKRERQVIVDAAEFLVGVQLPNLVLELSEHSAPPVDGTALVELMHARGINVRYLGKFIVMVEDMQRMEYVRSIAVTEVLFRSVKHVFLKYMQQVEPGSLSHAISHFLNCLLSSSTSVRVLNKNDDSLSKKKRKKTTQTSQKGWASLTPKSIWVSIAEDCQSYYSFKLDGDSIDAISTKYNVQKIALLRNFCLRCGVQLKLRDYSLQSRSSELFLCDDIMNMFPKVKHINPRATDAFNLYNAGQTRIQQGRLREGYSLISESLSLLNNVYGAMHPEIAQCLRTLSRLNYIMGEYSDAMVYQQKVRIYCKIYLYIYIF